MAKRGERPHRPRHKHGRGHWHGPGRFHGDTHRVSRGPGHKNIVQMLLDAEADVPSKNNSGRVKLSSN